MKTKIFLIALIMVSSSFITFSQIKTVSSLDFDRVQAKLENVDIKGTKEVFFTVMASCMPCKEKIEKAVALMDGVVTGKWIMDEQTLYLKYDSLKTSPDIIQKKIADMGYDTEKYRANDSVYALLNKECAYRTALFNKPKSF